MFCTTDQLHNESDVEQKLVWPLLTSPSPRGLGYTPADVRTKPDIRRLLIGKGETAKLYYPDYVVVIAGLPILVVEVKHPSEDLLPALREARLYAGELNAFFPSGTNPCTRIVITNGLHLITSPWDSDAPDLTLNLDQMDLTNPRFAELVTLLSRDRARKIADVMVEKLVKRPFVRPIALLGGQSVRNEEIGYNTFGARLAVQYRHLFNPSSREDRSLIARNAYIRSQRRERYIEPIDRVVRAAISPAIAHALPLEDTTTPTEIIQKLRATEGLEHEVLLLVGSVGSGKSTFTDYLREVALPSDVRDRTVWVNIDLNEAPVVESDAYTWIKRQLIAGLKAVHPTTDFDAFDVLSKVYAVELQKLRKGALSILACESEAYKLKLYDAIVQMQRDDLLTAQALARYICAERGKALIVVLDNCDKRQRDHQLLMFQLAQWMKREFRCLVFLPIRDVTYDHHRNEPPLDTALKDLVFRIEPPLFSAVLASRVALALAQMKREMKETVLSYTLPNGIVVEYPASDQGMYLASIMRSLFEHDLFVRRMITALAGRDVRRAMEIFLEFCTSGHIGEDEIHSMRANKGNYTLPIDIVSRVLLRMNRRFYDGNQSYLKNLFQCNPSDASPDHFLRYRVLRWLRDHMREPGPTGVRGYHRCETMVRDLILAGHDADIIRRETLYLVKSGCILTEHQDSQTVSDEDLIALSPGGWVHLELPENVDYLAACSEDLWMSTQDRAARIAERIGAQGTTGHYSAQTVAENAYELLDYLREYHANQVVKTADFLEGATAPGDAPLPAMGIAIKRCEYNLLEFNPWYRAEVRYPVGTTLKGRVTGLQPYGAFVSIGKITGLVHVSTYRNPESGPTRDVRFGDVISVRVLNVDSQARRMALEIVDG